MSKRAIIIWSAICAAVLIICIALDIKYRIGYIGVGGVIFFSVGMALLALIEKVRFWRETKRTLKELDEEDPESPETVGELMQMSFGFTKETKRKLKTAPLGDKFKVIAVFLPFGLLLTTMAVGVFLARLGTLGDGTITKLAIIGFVLMGIGGGGFLLEIILLIIISSIKNR